MGSAHSHSHVPSSGPALRCGETQDRAHYQLQLQRRRRLIGVMLLTATFMAVEFFGGLWTGSLALLSDAAHMLTDLASLVIATIAIQLSMKRATLSKSYGYQRAEVLAALVNSVIILVLSIFIILEAWERFHTPKAILSVPMLFIASGGFFVNLIGMRLLHSLKGESLNVRGAYLHLWGDLLGSLCAVTSALLILFFNWLWADAVMSAIIAVLIVVAGTRLLWETFHILMQGSPEGLDQKQMMGALQILPDVVSVTHLHVWCLAPEQTVATVHLKIADAKHLMPVLRSAEHCLEHHFGISHSTIQVEINAPEPESKHA